MPYSFAIRTAGVGPRRNEKNDAAKVAKSFDHRLRELTGFVAFDQPHHYQIDMPEGWRNWEDVKNAKE